MSNTLATVQDRIIAVEAAEAAGVWPAHSFRAEWVALGTAPSQVAIDALDAKVAAVQATIPPVTPSSLPYDPNFPHAVPAGWDPNVPSSYDSNYPSAYNPPYPLVTPVDVNKVRAAQAEADANAQAKDLHAQAAVLTDQAAALHAQAKNIAVAASEVKPGDNYVRAEGGGWIEVEPIYGPHDMVVTGLDHKYYDHVGSHPVTGEWTYRVRVH